MELNQQAPDFELPDILEISHRLSDHRGRIVIVNFWSCECPHSERTDRLLTARLIRWQNRVALLTVATNSNESVDDIRRAAAERRLPVVLIDAQGEAADLYEAVTTPHAYVIDSDGILRYRGAVDNVAPGQRNATRFYVEEAVEALLEERPPPVQEQAPFGCAIVRGF